MPFGKVTLNDGREIPEIAFGTGSVWKRQDATPFVAQALQSGFVHVDTAQAYQNEESIPAALKETNMSRDKVWITTKYWKGGPYGSLGIRNELLKSLERLQTSSVDLYLIHGPEGLGDTIANSWEQFEAVAQEGLAKSIGVSNFTKPDLEELMSSAKLTPAVNQIQLNPYTLAQQQPVIDLCRKHGIVIEAYSPLRLITRYPGGPVDEPVRKAAERLNATPVQVLLAWVRSKGAVVVTTSSKAERLQEYLAAGDLPPLTNEEIAAIDEAGRQGPVALESRGLTKGFENTGVIITFQPDPLISGRVSRFGTDSWARSSKSLLLVVLLLVFVCLRRTSVSL
ncbi:hypothetical protein M407DRAFT_214936 [Tulasnella calospora MUT 4182]|uniref:NADP-dependent oxidoreductase domain-containing protein n=1 Tax=Tulasnella calospora MUT 4182 TaxID=1051891 RepID=A0A0C3QE73_9AGAM|nr:hypothetical protein M407DRAFT_214936 [Tulasnella calospora MUT 4182]